jgi:beta-glucosidase
MGWFGDPLVFGRYPDSMVELVGDRLPRFSRLQKSRLLGSFDFLGLNHYSSKFYSEKREVDSIPSWGSDQQNIESKYSQSGQIIGPQAASSWLNLVPWGFYKVLMWSSRRYTRNGQPPPPIIVTENGCDAPGESLKQLPEVLHDSFRVDYLRQYLEQLDRAVRDGAHIRGYFAWSLLDNFEWADGFNYRFGLHYVDYTTPQRTRTPKDSAMWFSSHVRNHTSSQSYNNTKGANNKFPRSSRSWIGLLSAALHNSENGWLVSKA